MSTPKVYSKIFWPEHCLYAPSGYLVGWNIRSFIACVIAVISDVELEELEAELNRLSQDNRITAAPSGVPKILGVWLAPGVSSRNIRVPDVHEVDIWLTIEKGDKCPLLREICCYGYRYQSGSRWTSAQIIFYTQPSSNYYSDKPLELSSHSIQLTCACSSIKLTELDYTLRQISSSKEMESILSDMVAKYNRLPQPAHTKNWFSWMTTPFLYILLIFSLVAKFGLKLLSVLHLRETTTVGRTLAHRLEILQKWPVVWRDKLCAHPWWRNNNCVRATYIDFFNSIWLVCNDILLGIISGYLLYVYKQQVIDFFDWAHDLLTNDILRSLILWLMGWPAGFKLNDNLDKFLGLLFLYYIDKWTVIMGAITSYGLGEYIMNIVSLSGVLGLSVLVSLLLDLFSLWTVHITCFYIVSARFHHLQLILLSSLWKLFRGMKYNPLKKRIDSSDYDLDQLLLGTIVFTLLFFLFPTTALYYFFFAVLHLATSAVGAVGNILLELLAHFPLYHLVKYVLDPAFLPAGIRFAVPQQQIIERKTTFLKLETQPLQLSALFFHQHKEMTTIFQSYTIHKLAKCFITGAAWNKNSPS